MAVRDVLQLGNPRLHEPAAPVTEDDLGDLESVVTDLHDTLSAFRDEYGAGRAVAAPQIGVMKRLVYLHPATDEGPIVFCNPTIEAASDDTFALWDDCMSFPELLVRVERHRRVTVTYRGEQWEERTVAAADDVAELLQHEIDHLDGVLATQRAIDDTSFALRSQRAHLEGDRDIPDPGDHGTARGH